MKLLNILAILALITAATGCGSSDSGGGASSGPACSDNQLAAYDDAEAAVRSGSTPEIDKVCHDDKALFVVDCHLDCSLQGTTVDVFCAPDSDGNKSTNGENIPLTNMYHACGA